MLMVFEVHVTAVVLGPQQLAAACNMRCIETLQHATDGHGTG